MAKIQITFYKGVPFDPKNENVLLGDNMFNGNSVDDFLSRYEINVRPVDVDMFAIQGTDENGFIDVDLSFEPYDANYMKVLQFLDNGEILTKFYFIDEYTMQSRLSFRLFVHIDIWQTYGRKDSMHVTNAMVSQATRFSDANWAKTEKMTPTTSRDSSYNKTYLINEEYRIVFHFTCEPYGELAVISENKYVLNEAYEQALRMTQFSEIKIRQASGINYSIQPLDCFVIPEQFIGNFSQFTSDDLFYFTQDQVSTRQSPDFRSVARINDSLTGTSIVYTNEFEFTVKPEEAKITWLSTGNVSVQLPFTDLTYTGTIRVAIKNDIGIELAINNQFFNILDDYRVNNAISEFAQWSSQNKNAESARKTNETLGIIGSGLGVVGSLASGNVLGTIGSGLNLVQTIQGIKTNDAVIRDRQNSPLKLTSDTNQILGITKTRGLALFSIQPDNYYLIKKYNKYCGFIVNQYYNNVPFSIMPTEERFVYYRCESMEINGEFSMSVRNRLKELFTNGIRVWQYGKHFLDSFDNKLSQEEIDALGE